MNKPVFIIIISVETAVCADPELAAPVFIEALNPVVAQTMGIVRILFIYRKSVAVISIESVLRPQP